MKPKRIGIVSKRIGEEVIQTVKEIKKHLESKAKIKISYEDHLARKLNSKDIINPKKVDMILSVGGDGTVLKAVRMSSGTRVPSIGIKKGGMGFLAEIGSDIKENLNRLLEGDFYIEKRTKLDIFVNNKKIGEALNDAVIVTAKPAKIQKFSIEIHGSKIQEIAADGIIIATPTGSTAYALSAGGPILDPTLDAYEIAPICPFKMSARAIIVPAKTKTTLRVITDREAVLAIDGKDIQKISRKDKVHIVKSKHKAHLVKFENDFFKKVKKKLT